MLLEEWDVMLDEFYQTKKANTAQIKVEYSEVHERPSQDIYELPLARAQICSPAYKGCFNTSKPSRLQFPALLREAHWPGWRKGEVARQSRRRHRLLETAGMRSCPIIEAPF